jgi:hypothetical protein
MKPRPWPSQRTDIQINLNEDRKNSRSFLILKTNFQSPVPICGDLRRILKRCVPRFKGELQPSYLTILYKMNKDSLHFPAKMI